MNRRILAFAIVAILCICAVPAIAGGGQSAADTTPSGQYVNYSGGATGGYAGDASYALGTFLGDNKSWFEYNKADLSTQDTNTFDLVAGAKLTKVSEYSITANGDNTFTIAFSGQIVASGIHLSISNNIEAFKNKNDKGFNDTYIWTTAPGQQQFNPGNSNSFTVSAPWVTDLSSVFVYLYVDSLKGNDAPIPPIEPPVEPPVTQETLGFAIQVLDQQSDNTYAPGIGYTLEVFTSLDETTPIAIGVSDGNGVVTFESDTSFKTNVEYYIIEAFMPADDSTIYVAAQPYVPVTASSSYSTPEFVYYNNLIPAGFTLVCMEQTPGTTDYAPAGGYEFAVFSYKEAVSEYLSGDDVTPIEKGWSDDNGVVTFGPSISFHPGYIYYVLEISMPGDNDSVYVADGFMTVIASPELSDVGAYFNSLIDGP